MKGNDYSELILLKLYFSSLCKLTYIWQYTAYGIVNTRRNKFEKDRVVAGARLLRQWSELSTGSLIHLIIFKFPPHREIRSPGFQRRGSLGKHVCARACSALSEFAQAQSYKYGVERSAPQSTVMTSKHHI